MGVGVCHCTDCQKASGGGPNYVALAPKTAFEVTKGEARVYFSKGDSGEDAGRAFCPNCGTPLWSLPANAPFTTVKLGALDHNSDLTPALHLYTASATRSHLALGRLLGRPDGRTTSEVGHSRPSQASSKSGDVRDGIETAGKFQESAARLHSNCRLVRAETARRANHLKAVQPIIQK
jgi:hypothetical protein